MEGNTEVSNAKAVTDDSFDADVLASPRPVIVEYWAPWCGPCRMVSPVLDEIATEYAGRVDVVKLNTDENPQSMVKYGVMAVPTINLFSGGEVVKQVIGAKSKSALLREFGEFLA
jgi:thioredoxin 1